MVSNVKLYTLSWRQARTYLLATLFLAGNIVLPQLCHALMPKGGLIFLPIYFFTLIGAYKYGAKVGLLTALFSPVVNSMLFGMPSFGALPMILIKGTILAGAASFIAFRTKRVSVFLMFSVVLMYQVLGCGIEWAAKGNFMAGFQDFRLGLPGMVLQVIGGWALIKFALRK